MRTLILSLGLALAAVSAGAQASTYVANVEGLNCSLCGEKMQREMSAAAGAKAVSPKLECGKIYFEMAENKKVNEFILGMYLKSSGYNLKKVEPVNMAFAEAAKTEC